MPGQTETATQRVMDRIDEEHRRDAFIRRAAKIAWGVTFVIVLVLIGLTITQIVGMTGGNTGLMVTASLAMPLAFTLGALSVLVATLCTIGVFLRMRAASLQEIQLRLAALEQMLTRDS